MLEDKIVTISRAQGTLTFPANFMLIAAMNPCPCGYRGDPVKECTCSLTQVLRYQKCISGPLLDRIDIHPLRFASGIYDIEVPRVDYEKLAGAGPSRGSGFEPSAKIRERVERARDRQRLRFAGTTLQCNRDMRPAEVRQHYGLDDTGNSLLRSAMSQIPCTWRDSRCR